MLAVALIAAASAAPRGFAGLAWDPLSREDLVWVDESRTSGTAVGEFDGTVKPVLGAFGGLWFNKYAGLSLSLGVARLDQNTTTQDATTKRFQAVVRPGLDLRLGWAEPRMRRPIPWVLLGVSGDIPAARDRSTSYTSDEQDAADLAAENTRYRLGGIGGRVGLGLDYRLLPGLMIGAQVSVGLHRSMYAGGDARFSTLWVATEAGLLLTWEWNGPEAMPPIRREARERVSKDDVQP